MLDEQPRMFFIHFWANDDAVKLAHGIRAALDKTAVKKPMKEEAGSPVAAKHKEQVMKTFLIALAFAAIGTLVISTASAQQVRHGSVSKIDEPNGTITIQQTPDGTVGTSNAVSSDFKVQDGLLFNALGAGDKVTFTVDDINGAKTITKLQRE